MKIFSKIQGTDKYTENVFITPFPCFFYANILK